VLPSFSFANKNIVDIYYFTVCILIRCIFDFDIYWNKKKFNIFFLVDFFFSFEKNLWRILRRILGGMALRLNTKNQLVHLFFSSSLHQMIIK